MEWWDAAKQEDEIKKEVTQEVSQPKNLWWGYKKFFVYSHHERYNIQNNFTNR
jgi:hypothetical protein